MMKTLLKYFLAVNLVIFWGGCSEDDLGPSIFDVSPQEKNEIDEYISDNFVDDYNIDVIYRWDERENDKYYNLVPTKQELVLPMLQVIHDAWIEPYVKFGGTIFFKENCPKQISLVGSPGVNSDGTITQGTAEGGIKIVLYQINDFNKKNKPMLLRYFHVMHHEFGHILHQKKFYSEKFQTISGGYTSEWYLKSDNYANQRGFITPYAMLTPDEDFVEIIAMMLTHSNDEWNQMLVDIASKGPEFAAGVEIIKTKQTVVVDYFKNSWKIDIFALQADIYNRVTEIVN